MLFSLVKNIGSAYKLTAFFGTRIGGPSGYHFLAASEVDSFLFEIRLGFTFRDE